MNKQAVVDEMLDFLVKRRDYYHTSYEIALSFIRDYADFHGIKIDPVKIRKAWRDHYGFTDS